MLSKKYASNQLISILEDVFDNHSTGVISLTTNLPSLSQQRSCILILREGALVYGGTQVPQITELCTSLGRELKSNLIDTALPVAIQRAKEPNSIKEILALLIKLNIFTWQSVENLIKTKIVRILEKFSYSPGELTWKPNDDFDLCYGQEGRGLDWREIKQKLNQRQQQWQNYAPQIPSMDAIPVATAQQLARIDSSRIREHFINSVNGTNSLLDIADKMGRDPLSVAKSYFDWVNKGWVSCHDLGKFSPSINEIKHKISSNLKHIKPQDTPRAFGGAKETDQQQNNLPRVLSVDDSPIIQISIKRALQDHYQVLLANKAAQALEILQETAIELMLLDLTMPDVDGLEFCRTIRNIPRFQDLPIVMVTARDGLINQMKGRIAGTTKYVTKPFKPEELRQIVAQCITSKANSIH